MNTKPSLKTLAAGLSLALIFILVVLPAFPGSAALLLQPTPFPTPTPGPDGRILYTVQELDTLWSISAISGVAIDESRALNGLSANDVIVPGQLLLLGLAGPAIVSPTVGPTATPAPQAATPTPGLGTATLCVLLFEDINGDALRQDNEMSIPGGAVSISERSGGFDMTGETQPGDAADCFENIPEGAFNVTVAAPDGYNATTVMNYAIEVSAGDETYLDFGAQLNSEAQAEVIATAAPEAGGSSTLLGVLGGILILGGIGLGLYARQLMRPPKQLQ